MMYKRRVAGEVEIPHGGFATIGEGARVCRTEEGNMAQRPAMLLTATVLDAPDPPALAWFYHRLLGWPVTSEDPTWVTLRPPGGGPGLSFQLEELYVPPTWPAAPGAQQMMLHLDIEVENLETATAYAIECGATLAKFQPQEDVRVLLDPAGHPFCFFVRTD